MRLCQAIFDSPSDRPDQLHILYIKCECTLVLMFGSESSQQFEKTIETFDLED